MCDFDKIEKQNNPSPSEVVDVYIASLPANAVVGRLDCEERMKEIESVSNEKLKFEKYYVWKLLCYALERSFGMCRGKLSFTRESYGGWSVEGAEISLSHSDGVLAVAVSQAPVGVDIERVRMPNADRFAESNMNEEELASYEATADDAKESRLIELWTAKEAIFKSRKERFFLPKETNTQTSTFRTDSIEINGKKFVWSVATGTPESVRVFTDIDL